MSAFSNPSVDPAIQAAVAGEVNKRMANAVNDLQKKYEGGNQGINETSENGPTGEAYRKQMKLEAIKKKKEKDMKKSLNDNNPPRIDNNLNSDEDDDEDSELRLIREKRAKEIKEDQKQKIENLSKGHGQYREIVQDEFLNEVTSSKIVICHFYHDEFPRCKIFDHHLLRLADRHVETKFIKVFILFFNDHFKY
jgi:hypothetical protein